MYVTWRLVIWAETCKGSKVKHVIHNTLDGTISVIINAIVTIIMPHIKVLSLIFTVIYCITLLPIIVTVPCGGGLEYFHSSPATHRRRRKRNPVPGVITAPPCHWGT
jgi:hypothetical protein